MLNGNSIGATYTSNKRIDVLMEGLDGRTDDVEPDMIEGTGKLFRKTFWFDVGER